MCLELHPAGYCHVLLPTDDGKGRHFSWKKVTTKVNNLILGPLSLDHTGTMIIKDHTSTSQCRLEFEANAGGWFASGSSLGRIRGDVTDHSNAVRFQLEGNWMERLTCKSTLPCSALLQNLQLWKRNPFPECSSSNFNFTNFTMSLNQCPENLARSLPPTDSRLRPDQKAMEAGLWKDADTLKEQVETYQRIKREQIFADFALTGLPIGPEPQGIRIGEEWWVPRWFTREFDPDTKSETWKFKGDYWDIRKAQVGWPPYVYDIFCEPDK